MVACVTDHPTILDEEKEKRGPRACFFEQNASPPNRLRLSTIAQVHVSKHGACVQAQTNQPAIDAFFVFFL